MTDEELKRQADSDWIDHTDSPYERYLELKLARTVKQRDELTAALLTTAAGRDSLVTACAKLLAYRHRAGAINFQLEKADDYMSMIGAAIDAVREGEPAKT